MEEQNKKYDQNTALAKIKARLSKYYEQVGRRVEEIDTAEEINELREELIADIDEIIVNTEISAKHVVLESLEADDEVKKALGEKWT